MTTVADYASEFADRARKGERPVARVGMEYVEAFLGQLFREGFAFAAKCLEHISDPHLRRIIEAIFFSTTAGAAVGAAIGGAVGGPGGAQVGAAVGAGVGLLASCVAIVITARQRQGSAGPVLEVTVQ